jgi:6-phosphogluconolactonase (cycloisomerase 2 family)
MFINKNEVEKIQKDLMDEIFSSLLNQSGTQLTREGEFLIAWKRRPDKMFKIDSSISAYKITTETSKEEQEIIISVYDGSVDKPLLRVNYTGRIDTVIDCIIAVTK